MRWTLNVCCYFFFKSISIIHRCGNGRLHGLAHSADQHPSHALCCPSFLAAPTASSVLWPLYFNIKSYIDISSPVFKLSYKSYSWCGIISSIAEVHLLVPWKVIGNSQNLQGVRVRGYAGDCGGLHSQPSCSCLSTRALLLLAVTPLTHSVLWFYIYSYLKNQNSQDMRFWPWWRREVREQEPSLRPQGLLPCGTLRPLSISSICWCLHKADHRALSTVPFHWQYVSQDHTDPQDGCWGLSGFYTHIIAHKEKEVEVPSVVLGGEGKVGCCGKESSQKPECKSTLWHISMFWHLDFSL